MTPGILQYLTLMELQNSENFFLLEVEGKVKFGIANTFSYQQIEYATFPRMISSKTSAI